MPRTDTQAIDYSVVRSFLLAPGLPDNVKANCFTLRHDWGLKSGEWVLNLTGEIFISRMPVFVALSEGEETGTDKTIGEARCTLHNVAPSVGRVNIWVEIVSPSPIRLLVDYLMIQYTSST
jgi:hypothetical protein